MEGIITQVKNIQTNPGGTPYIYFDSQLFELLGLTAKTQVQIIFDLNKKEVSITKASKTKPVEAAT